MTDQDRIRDLALALKEVMLWSYVEEKPGPTYRVPSHIDGDLFRWVEVKGKKKAYDTIKAAVDRAAKGDCELKGATFYEWLMRFGGHKTPLGDLANDVKHDSATKGLPNTLAAWQSHLRGMQACGPALDALNAAWKTYKRSSNRTGETN